MRLTITCFEYFFQYDLLDHFRCVVVGGGSAGLGIASKLARRLPAHQVAVVEPHETHYYQPGLSLVASGLMPISQIRADESTLIPRKVKWIREGAEHFEPASNSLTLRGGRRLTYDMLFVCTGVQLRFDLVEGLPEALKTPHATSMYDPAMAEKTLRLINSIKKGPCVFTLPNAPIKCPGAPQKICYLAEEIIRSNGYRDKTEFHYYTPLPRIFGVVKYAEALTKIINEHSINLHVRRALIKVDGDRRIAYFDNVDKPGEDIVEQEYSMLHVGPPCSSIKPVRECKELVDEKGFVDVNPRTLQSTRFPNVFAIGDCANSPNAKTAAAISSQLKTVGQNAIQVLGGKMPTAEYDGYASCPLLVSRSKVILAEFLPSGEPLETFPYNQANPTWIAFFMKKYAMPFLYWHGLIKGYWNGPAKMRKLLAPFKRN